MPINSEVSYVRINDQDFEFMVALSNQVDGLAPIDKSAIARLVIEDTFAQWWCKGFLIFDNKFNALERPRNDDEGEKFNYHFRNDGKDTIIFRFRPVLQGQADDLLPNDIWNMEYVFSVYDIQDITDGANADTKYKKLFFWEYEHQLMLQKKLNWSTAEILPTDIVPSQAGDDDRKVFIGDAIKSLLTKALPDKVQEFSDTWERGGAKIDYHQGANESVSEVLEWMIKKHVGAIDNDPCYIDRERYSKKWVLQSLSHIFSKAVEGNGPGAYQLEQFFVDSMTEMENATDSSKDTIKNPAPYKTPVSPKNVVSFERNIQLRDYSLIKSFELADMAAMDNMMALVSTPTYSNSIHDKQFNLEFENHDIVNIKDFFQRTYTDKLKHAGCDPDPLFTLNKLKNDAYAISNIYSLGETPIERLSDGRNEILKSAVFLNQCIVFKVKGMSFRMAGKFIGIDREIGATQNEFDDKLLGQWFVTGVKHIFVGEAYLNEITAIKLHASNPLNINKVEAYSPTT